jgi:hypothetical protein
LPGNITPVPDDDRGWDAGVRLNIMADSGKPTNDVLGYGSSDDIGSVTAGLWGSGSSVDVDDQAGPLAAGGIFDVAIIRVELEAAGPPHRAQDLPIYPNWSG